MELKHISHESVPRALALAERYRLLNEPEQAASICEDVLIVEPDNQDALFHLLLALTEQFGRKRGATCQKAEQVANRMADEYKRTYYRGVVFERWGRSKLEDGSPARFAADWLHKAMEHYEEAEKIRPEGDDAALLRWNTCARLMHETPELMNDPAIQDIQFGD
jgi:hypothetical protein